MATKPTATKKPTPPAVISKNEGSSSIPAHLRNRETATSSTMRREDLIIPRVKLLQGLSPEVMDGMDGAKAGIFWHNIMNAAIGDDNGKAFDFICFKSRFFYILFAPRGHDPAVLARANDGVHWQPSEGSFTVKPKKAQKPVTYHMKPTVAGSGLAEFGTSVPGDPNSQPAATLIYEYLMYMPDYPDLGAMIMSLARSQIKKGKVINTAHSTLQAPMSGVKFRAEVVREQGDEGPYYNYQFKRAGWATEDETDQAETYAAGFKGREYRAAGEEELGEEGGSGPKDAPKNAKGY